MIDVQFEVVWTLEKGAGKISGPVGFLTNKDTGKVFPVGLSDPKAREAFKSSKHIQVMSKIIAQSTGTRGGDHRKHIEHFAAIHADEAKGKTPEEFAAHLERKIREHAGGSGSLSADVVTSLRREGEKHGAKRSNGSSGSAPPPQARPEPSKPATIGRWTDYKHQNPYEVGKVAKVRLDSGEVVPHRVVKVHRSQFSEDPRTAFGDRDEGWYHSAEVVPLTDEEHEHYKTTGRLPEAPRVTARVQSTASLGARAHAEAGGYGSKKAQWWLKNEDTGEFVNVPNVSGRSGFNEDLSLTPGKYTLGVGVGTTGIRRTLEVKHDGSVHEGGQMVSAPRPSQSTPDGVEVVHAGPPPAPAEPQPVAMTPTPAAPEPEPEPEPTTEPAAVTHNPIGSASSSRRVVHRSGRVEFEFPFDRDMNESLKRAFPGRVRFDGAAKRWHIAASPEELAPVQTFAKRHGFYMSPETQGAMSSAD